MADTVTSGLSAGELGNNNSLKTATKGEAGPVRNVDPAEINAKLKYATEHMEDSARSEIVDFFRGRNRVNIVTSVLAVSILNTTSNNSTSLCPLINAIKDTPLRIV